MKNKLLWLAIPLCLISIRASATIVYVDSANIAGNQDGTTWASAYYSFYYGIDFANPGDTIWVAKGTYLPIAGTFFSLKKDVKIYGGFKNTDTAFSQRNWVTNVTRLKGNGHSVIRNDSAQLITSTTVLDGFTISNGFAGNYSAGGGMYNRHASPTITNCIFANNSVSGITSGGGGGMTNYNCSPYIAYCTFISNTAPIFYGNPPNASGSGGGGALVNGNASPVIYRCTFSNNSSTTGGAMYNVDNSHPTISYCTFNNNTVTSVSITTKGGAIYNASGSTLNLDSCKFSSNYANRGGAIYNDTLPSSTITRCAFLSNTGVNGAAIYHMSTTTANTMDSCYFYNNGSTSDGGGIYAINSLPVITNTNFLRNRSNTVSIGASGSNIFATGNSSLNVSNCKFTGTVQTSAGIIIENAPSLVSAFNNCRFEYDSSYTLVTRYSPVNINYCEFYANRGPLSITGNQTTTGLSTVANCTFANNVSNSYGGALFISDASPIINNCTFTSNTTAGIAAYRLGGAIYINNSFNLLANPTITQCSFTGNSANKGGAIYNADYGEPDITNCIFTNNSATNQGGGIWGYAAKIRNCNFTGNNTVGYGGALYGVSYPVEHTIFAGNTARIGGGIYSASSFTSVENCLFTKNAADSFGGGMYNSAPPAFVTNATFFGNRANVLGGPIYNTNYGDYNDSTFTNCIIWGNNSGIYNQNTAATAFSYSLVQGLGTFAVKHIIGGTVNPQFVDTATGNFQLLPGSPCIDIGKNSYIPTGVLTDLANGIRIQNNIVDFGAFEFGNVPLGMDLLHFSGKMLNNNSVLLEWQMNNDKPVHTTLQRSQDGKNFKPIYSVRTNSGLNNQSYVDEQPLDENYYRLEIVDEQGSLHYSNTVFVRLNTSSLRTVVYPNPAKEGIHLVTKATELLNSTATITDLTGKVMFRTNITSADQQISLTNLPQGIYLLRLANGTIFKISKQ